MFNEDGTVQFIICSIDSIFSGTENILSNVCSNSNLWSFTHQNIKTHFIGSLVKKCIVNNFCAYKRYPNITIRVNTHC